MPNRSDYYATLHHFLNFYEPNKANKQIATFSQNYLLSKSVVIRFQAIKYKYGDY